MNPLRRALAGLLLGALALAARAEPAGFSAARAPAELAAAGLAKLSAEEKTTLDQLVAREVAAARQGGVSAFGGTFLSRRTAAERAAVGVAKLSPAEQAGLCDLVATAIATRPAPLAIFPVRTRVHADVQTDRAPGPQIHGEVSLTYGWSNGGSFKGASMVTTISDPKNRFSVTIGYSRMSGKGLPYYDGEPVDYIRRP